MVNFNVGMYIVIYGEFQTPAWNNRIGICTEVRPRVSMYPLEIEFVDNCGGAWRDPNRRFLPIRFEEVNVMQTFLLNKLLK